MCQTLIETLKTNFLEMRLILHVRVYFQCKALEKLGFDSLIVIASKDRHMELGSSKGKSFIEAFPDYFEDFVHYCKGELPNFQVITETSP